MTILAQKLQKPFNNLSPYYFKIVNLEFLEINLTIIKETLNTFTKGVIQS